MSKMHHLTYIKNAIDELGSEIDSYPLKSEDIRTSYLELTFSVLDLYYRQCCSLYSAKIIQEKAIDATEDEEAVLNIFLGSVSNTTTFYSVLNNINRSLLVDSWSTFEFCLTYMCDSLFDGDAKKHLLEYDLREVDKILSKYAISEGDRRKIEKKFIKGHVTHVPVVRKYGKVYSLFKDNYSGEWEEDSEFLEFYGKYRNCLHTNYLYHGNDKKYTFLGTTFIFENGEPVAHSKQPDIKEMFDLALKLKSTCRKLFDAVQYTGLLPYPSDKVIQP